MRQGEAFVDFFPSGKGGDVAVDLPFVIGSAAGEKFVSANGGGEGGRGPEVEGFRGLNVVMAVDEDVGGGVFGGEAFGGWWRGGRGYREGGG